MLATHRWAEQQQRALRDGAHPKIIKFEAAFIRRLKKAGIPAFCHQMIRTQEEQALHFEAGRTKVAPSAAGWPHRGCAVDIVHTVKGWEVNDQQWLLLGHMGKEITNSMGLGIEWGGDWRPNSNGVGWDPAHWQLKNWRTIQGEYPWPTT